MDEAWNGLRRLTNTHPVKCYLCLAVVLTGGGSKLMMSEDGLDYAWLCPPCKEANPQL